MPEASPDGGEVLVAEDDDSAYFLIQMAFAELEDRYELFRVHNGAQALAFLRGQEPFSGSPRPALVLLNLNMPRVDGFQVLSQVKSDPDLRGIPVVVFSSSRLDSDRARCLTLGADAFLSKPDTFDDVVTAVRSACGHAQ